MYIWLILHCWLTSGNTDRMTANFVIKMLMLLDNDGGDGSGCDEDDDDADAGR